MRSMWLWNMLLDENTLKVFEWDSHKNGAWASELHDLCVTVGCEDVFTNKVKFDFIYSR